MDLLIDGLIIVSGLLSVGVLAWIVLKKVE